MKKTELEELVKCMSAQIDALNKRYTDEINRLQQVVNEYEREKGEYEQREKEDSEEERQERMEAHHAKILELFAERQEDESCPSIGDYADNHFICSLMGMADEDYIMLIRHHFNNELADAYQRRRMNWEVFRALASYFESCGSLVVTDEMKAEAKRLKEERRRIKPTSGAFRLRGREELETFFNEQVVDIVNNIDAYAAMGVAFPKGFILEGAPGCGKTFAVERLAEHLGWHTERIDSSTIGSGYIHETAKKIEECFQRAADNAPSILIIDEMEAFMPNRAELSSRDNHCREEVDSFLKCLQTAGEKRILVVGMTNLISTLDPAVLRTGRLGTHIKVDMPSQEEVEDVLAYALAKRPHETFDLQPHAAQLLGHPLSDVVHVVDEAAMAAVRARRKTIRTEDLQLAIERLVRRQEIQREETLQQKIRLRQAQRCEAPETERRRIGFAA